MSNPFLDDFIKFFSSDEEEEEKEKEEDISIPVVAKKGELKRKTNTKDDFTPNFAALAATAMSEESRSTGNGTSHHSGTSVIATAARSNHNHIQTTALYSYLSVDPLSPLPVPPWTPVNRIYSRNYLSFLDEEILDYAEFVAPTKGEHLMRSFTLERLRNQVCKLWPQAKLACFGSFETQLYLPSSDLDCCIIESSVFVPACLYKLRDQLNKADIAVKLDVIPSTKVPILKYVDSLTRFNVDISFNSTNGIETAKIVRGFVQHAKLGDITRILLLLVKQFLTQRYLNEVYTGGLSSYALLCMIVSYLRLHPKIQTGEIDPLKNVGLLLIEFFELYGKWFNNDSLSIHVFGEEGSKYSYRRQEGRPTPLSVIDPQDPKNNISAGSFNYTQVKGSFMRAFTMLTSMLGSGFERHHAQPSRIRPGQQEMITMLGSILTVSKSVLDQREYIERVHEAFLEKRVGLTTHSLEDSVCDGGSSVGGGTIASRGMTGKRKRGDSSSSVASSPGAGADAATGMTEVVFVENSSSEEDLTEDEEEEEEGALHPDSGDDGDITAFYSMNTGKPSKQELQQMDPYRGRAGKNPGQQSLNHQRQQSYGQPMKKRRQ